VFCKILRIQLITEISDLFSYWKRRGIGSWHGGPSPRHESVDVLYAAPQAYGIVNVTLHWEYSPGIVFIFSQGRNDLYHV
jgi:hypothetical protein